jgi:hypothetical protein
MTNMLMVTTTEGVLHRVHGYTSHSGPSVSLHSILVEGSASLEHRLVGSASARHHTYHGSGSGKKGLLGARGKSHSGGALVLVVGDDHTVFARGSGVLATVTGLGFYVADHTTLRDAAKREDVADGQGSLLATVHGLTKEHTLGSHHELSVSLESVSISELDSGHRGASTRVVEDLLDHTVDVAVSFGVIQGSHLGGPLSVLGMGSKHGALTLSLDLNCLSHR